MSSTDSININEGLSQQAAAVIPARSRTARRKGWPEGSNCEHPFFTPDGTEEESRARRIYTAGWTDYVEDRHLFLF